MGRDSLDRLSAGAASRQHTRNVPLDGLRGIAALTVVLCHVCIASAAPLANAYVPAGSGAAFPSLDWLLVNTPLHLFWAGQEAVLVFFVLSGYVLALPASRGGRFAPLSYYPKRAVRLYVPVWAAVALGFVLHTAVAHTAVPEATWWLSSHAEAPTTGNAIQALTLVKGFGGWAFDPVLWSLQWEVLFSLLLPAYLLIGHATRRLPPLALVAAAAALFATAHFDGGAGRYMPVFLLGTLMAFQQEPMARLAGRLRRHRWLGRAIGAVSVLGLTAMWWLPGGAFGSATGAARAAGAFGAALAVTLAATAPGFARMLVKRPVRWAGSRSFSIYLVHEPLVVALAFALGAATRTVPFAIVAIPLALLAGELFFRAIERPSHQASRRAGRLWRGVAPGTTRPEPAEALAGRPA